MENRTVHYCSTISGSFFEQDLVMSHFISLYLTMVFQYLESTLHNDTLVVDMSDKPQTSFQVVRNNLCYNGMHRISEPVYWTLTPFYIKADDSEYEKRIDANNLNLPADKQSHRQEDQWPLWWSLPGCFWWWIPTGRLP